MLRKLFMVLLALSSTASGAGAASLAAPELMTLDLAASAHAAAATAPELLTRSSGSVSISRSGAENPMVEIARSIFWGGIAGFTVGTAITLADDHHSGEPMRWGTVIGTFAGLGVGVYFVATRPIPESMLEIRHGRLEPNAAALAAVEPASGGVRVRLIGTRF